MDSEKRVGKRLQAVLSACPDVLFALRSRGVGRCRAEDLGAPKNLLGHLCLAELLQAHAEVVRRALSADIERSNDVHR